MTLGVLGPVAYGLGLTDAVLYGPWPHKSVLGS
jgi:hypothetical protein